MILDRHGKPMRPSTAPPPRLMLPIGRVNPEDMRSRRRTKNGKPVIKVVAEMKKRDFVKLREDGSEQSYTPIEQNLEDGNLFRLRRYDSPTAALVPRNAPRKT